MRTGYFLHSILMILHFLLLLFQPFLQRLSFSMSVCLFVCLSVCLIVCLSVNLFFCLSVCLLQLLFLFLFPCSVLYLCIHFIKVDVRSFLFLFQFGFHLFIYLFLLNVFYEPRHFSLSTRMCHVSLTSEYLSLPPTLLAHMIKLSCSKLFHNFKCLS